MTITLNSITRRELAPVAGANQTVLRWQVDYEISAFQMRNGGESRQLGLFIPEVIGSANTKGSNRVAAGTEIRTLLFIDDFVRNEQSVADGGRDLVIHVQKASDGSWSEVGAGSLEVELWAWRSVPVLEESGLTLQDGRLVGNLVLDSEREFQTKKLDDTLPSGANYAVDIELPDESVTGVLSSTQALFPPHVDGTGPTAHTVSFDASTLPSGLFVEETEVRALLRFQLLDAFGNKQASLIETRIRVASALTGEFDYRYRDALPADWLNDKDYEKTGKVYDLLIGHYEQENDRLQTLIDIENCPESSLPYHFKRMGLTYPNVPGYPVEALRRLLKNANEINKSRFSEPGIKFYLALLVPGATVTIGGINRGLIFYPNSETLGLPNAADIATSGTDDDVTPYLFGPVSPGGFEVNISGGNPSEALKEFIRDTINQEFLYHDDPVNPLPITINYS